MICKTRDVSGFNLALLSTVPLGGGVSSSAAIEVAAMMNVTDHSTPAPGIRSKIDPLLLASMCQEVENNVVGAPAASWIKSPVAPAKPDSLLRMVCQPHELLPPLQLPSGIRVVGINSNVKHSVGGGMYGITRCAASWATKSSLKK